MRIAVLGDIHANHFALRAVLDAARREGVDHLAVNGDLVGYYYWPAEVLELLKQWPRWTIAGNHERLLARARRDPQVLAQVTAKYGSGHAVALEALTAAQLDALESLPQAVQVEVEGRRILMAHGTPWDADEYLYPDAATARWLPFADCDADVVMIGHTHYRLVRQIGSTLIINPGSVGQPRDRIPGAPWVLFDTATLVATPFNEPYDASHVGAQARLRDPALPYLHEVLCRVAQS